MQKKKIPPKSKVQAASPTSSPGDSRLMSANSSEGGLADSDPGDGGKAANVGSARGARGRGEKGGSSGLDCELGADLGKLIQLFEQRSDELRFPGVTASSLGEARERVSVCEQNVDGRRESLLQAEAELAAGVSELRSLAQKAVAYARVFAEADAELRAELESLALGSKAKGKRRRKTMQRREPESRTLPFTGPGATSDADNEHRQTSADSQAELPRKSA